MKSLPFMYEQTTVNEVVTISIDCGITIFSCKCSDKQNCGFPFLRKRKEGLNNIVMLLKKGSLIANVITDS